MVQRPVFGGAASAGNALLGPDVHGSLWRLHRGSMSVEIRRHIR